MNKQPIDEGPIVPIPEELRGGGRRRLQFGDVDRIKALKRWRMMEDEASRLMREECFSKHQAAQKIAERARDGEFEIR